MRPKRSKTQLALPLSEGWLQHFFVSTEGTAERKCKLCASVVKGAAGATSNYARHLRRNHEDKLLAYNDLVTKKKCESSIKFYCVPKSGSSAIATLTSSDTVRIDNALIEMICKDFEPLYICKRQGLQGLLNACVNGYTLPSYETVRYNMLPKKVMEIENCVHKLLSSCRHVALTVDIWSSRAMMSFIGVTVHFVTPQLEPGMAVLACRYFPGVHTAEAVQTAVSDIVIHWKIASKVIRVLTDNGRNIIKAFRLPGFELTEMERSADEQVTDDLGKIADEFDVIADADAMTMAFDSVLCCTHSTIGH